MTIELASVSEKCELVGKNLAAAIDFYGPWGAFKVTAAVSAASIGAVTAAVRRRLMAIEGFFTVCGGATFRYNAGLILATSITPDTLWR